MRSSLSGSVVLVVLAATSASTYGCASSPASSGNPFGAAGAALGTAGSNPNPGGSGATGASGSVGMAGASSGGAATTAGAGGAATTAGAGGASTAGAAGMSTAGAGGGSAGGSPMSDITAVVNSAGCGMDPTGMTPGETVKFTIQTSGTKPSGPPGCTDSKCGPWSYPRDYYVTLPAGYDKSKAYPLVFEGPGCTGDGTKVYPLTDPSANNTPNVNNTVIRVGLTPPPDTIGHATNPNQGCFDDKEGDSSVDWVFYENLYDKLSGQICFDRNRVFSAGDSSGGWFSNELGCKYAGDPLRPVRGILPNTGGLPTTVGQVPTCTTKPMAGIWVGQKDETVNPFAGNVVAINRAIQVNGCTGGNWGVTPTANYPIGGGKDPKTCQQITGCPALYPLVVCILPGNTHAANDDTVEPGFTTFLKSFSKPPLAQ
jgi:polyhydroxybutyrate depolymerase